MIEHVRRRILPFNVTRNPTADLVVQQLREAFSEAVPYRYAILDRDSIFDPDVIAFLKATGLKPKRASRQSPWQDGTAERWIRSCRREMLDYVIAFNEDHLRRRISDYVRYYHEDRIHDSLDKDAPLPWAVETKPAAEATLISLPRLGGLHHRYAVPEPRSQAIPATTGTLTRARRELCWLKGITIRTCRSIPPPAEACRLKSQ